MKQEFLISTFYKFQAIEQDCLSDLRQKLVSKAEDLEIKGLLLIGVEGCNATISGKEEKLREFIGFIEEQDQIGALECKESYGSFQPFRRFKVDIREEIVTLKDKEIVPECENNNHLTPKEWQAVLDSKEDFVLIDTRNFYETDVGLFPGAIDLKLKKFSEFPQRVKDLNIPRDKKILMYCTGGIRCEKAIIDMQRDGYQKVFQLQGGILKYLEELPNQSFEGECFVFDHRVALGQDLQPSKIYKLCPHCGNPARLEINCGLCDKPAKVCDRCIGNEHLKSCSKNCAHHLARKQHAQSA